MIGGGVGLIDCCCWIFSWLDLILGNGDDGISSQPENDEVVSSFVVDKLRVGLGRSLDVFSLSNWRKSSSVKLLRSTDKWRFADKIFANGGGGVDLHRLLSSRIKFLI